MIESNANQWVSVQGDFTQPTYKSDSVSGSTESSWVGIGGKSGGGLIQAGTAMYNNTYTAWYEYLGKNNAGVNQINLPSIVVRPGDKIHVYVSFETSNKRANFYVINNTTGKSQSVTVSLDPSIYYDGTWAEWIDERQHTSVFVPAVGYSNSYYTSLADYGSTSWTNCQAYTTGGVWQSLGSQSHILVTMKNGSTILSMPGSISSNTSFTDYFFAAY